jgi:hypothetical protein
MTVCEGCQSQTIFMVRAMATSCFDRELHVRLLKQVKLFAADGFRSARE